MGADIHDWVEVRENGEWKAIPYHPFNVGRSYAIFGFLADVRNYSHAPVIADPRGLPVDASDHVKEHLDDNFYHSQSWVGLRELLAYDYDKVFWDRRVTKQIAHNAWDGAALAEEGEGQHITMREHLGQWFFDVLSVLERLGDPDDVRLVFGFDS